jgi:GntR family transcriptional regulator / MocR family aminotransferase
MARRTGFGLALSPRDPESPAYRWLYAALRAAILQGQLHPGTRLPSTRDLAVQYRLSRGTVVAAFAQLTAEGYVDGTVGSDTYVRAVLPDALLHVDARATARAVAERPRRRISRYGTRVQPFPPLEPRPSRAFRPNVPALDPFPIAVWAQLASCRMRRASTRALLSGDTRGYPPLREAVADYLATSRGVTCHPDQVMIVAGVQEALDLVARLVLDPGDRVCIEDPGYHGAALLFEAVGAVGASRPVSLPCPMRALLPRTDAARRRPARLRRRERARDPARGERARSRHRASAHAALPCRPASCS